jgi:hypothetical protein
MQDLCNCHGLRNFFSERYLSQYFKFRASTAGIHLATSRFELQVCKSEVSHSKHQYSCNQLANASL